MKAELPKIYNAGDFEQCWKGTCQVRDHIITSNTFTAKHVGKCLKFILGPLTVSQKKFFTFSVAKFAVIPLYVGKARTKFRCRFNNYKYKHRSFRKKKKNVPQKCLHSHYVQDCDKGADDLKVTLFEKCKTHKQLK